MEFEIGGSRGKATRIIYIGDGKLEYRARYHSKWSEPVHLHCDRERWEQFRRDLDSIGVWQWKQSCYTVDQDSIFWQLRLDFGARFLDLTGCDGYPDRDGFARFLVAVEKLIGLEGIRL
jgi:hypothetical protein